ncbi:MAG: hypothetical protein QME89_06150 [Actinomycetota bacterium]|nr:hypothetical protein [Actinomycetota bacterium]MDI7252126.1 hypothetical protein [Actinomycetota bacterium]
MSEEKARARLSGLPFTRGHAAGVEGFRKGEVRMAGWTAARGALYPRAEEVRGEVESLLEKLIALLQEARLLAESLREAAGEQGRTSRLCGELDAVTGELEALGTRMKNCLAGFPEGIDMPALARLLDRGEDGPVTSRLEHVGRLAAEVLQRQAANEKLFFLLGAGMERYLSVVAEASGGWVPYDCSGARRWTRGWEKRTLYST